MNTVSSLAKLSAHGGLNKEGSDGDISGMLGRLSSSWENMDPQTKHSLIGAVGGGVLGGGAGYLLSDKDSKGRGALTGMLAGAGLGGAGGYGTGKIKSLHDNQDQRYQDVLEFIRKIGPNWQAQEGSKRLHRLPPL